MNDPRAIVPVSLRKQLTQAMSYSLTGGFFSPQLPLQPQHQETEGRRFDYIAGYNISTRPRRDTGIDFQTLRNFAQYYDLLRILIEKRKDQISNFDWSIVPTDEAVAQGRDKDELNNKALAATKFLKYPDGRQHWNTWLRALIEDMIVLDAVSLWPVYKGNQLLRLESVDSATIKLVIDESGRTPEPPFPAYQQVLHGIPTADFRRDELLYFMSNPRTNAVYGLSKVEQIMITIQIGLRREQSQLQLFTDGNVPAALAGVPANWNMNQIAAVQTAFDSMLAGDTAARRKLWFVPGDTAKNIHEFKSEDATLKSAFDEWIMRIMCFTMGISPTPFINQVNRATAFTAQEEARDEGLGPQLTFIKTLIDTLLHKGMRLEGLEFKWSMEQENDPSTQSDIDDKMLRNGSRSLDELRQRDGLDPYGIGPMIFLPTGPISIADIKAGKTAPQQNPPPSSAPPPDDDVKHEPKPPGQGGATLSQDPAGKPGVPSAAKEAKRREGKAGADVDAADDSPEDPLDAKVTKRNKREVSARSAPPFRKKSAWHGYPAQTIRNPKGEAARARLIKASRGQSRPEHR